MDDKIKIKRLVNKLLHELEKQGYNLESTDEISGVDIKFFHNNDRFDDNDKIKNKLYVENILSGWYIDCGVYKRK